MSKQTYENGSSYRAGMMLGIAVITLSTCGIAWWNRSALLSETSANALAFDPPFVMAGSPWILPGESRQFEVMLHNRSRKDVWVDELRFSCPCASGTVARSRQLPIKVRRGRAVPVNVAVKSEKGESGELELRFGVIGRAGAETVEAGALATVMFVQPLNAQPSLLSLGELSKSAEIQQHTVTLWGPRGLAFSEAVTVESDDPCITVTLEPIHDEESVDSPRKEIAKLIVAVNPAKAPERLGTRITVRSGTEQVVIPIFGIFRP